MNRTAVYHCRCSLLVGAAAAATIISTYRWQSSSGETVKCAAKVEEGSKLVFLGTGSSTGCPKPLCAMIFQETVTSNPEIPDLQQRFESLCRTSRLAMQGDPRENRDYRNNPSLLIQFRDEEGVVRNVAIDVGKTFRETALRWMPFHNIRSLDAVVLTHHHMDAVAGLDDLRGFQKVQRRSLDPAVLPVRVPMSVFMSQECYDQVSSQFPWLFPQSVTFANTIKKRETVPRDVASLDVALIKDFEPFNAKGLTLVPLPVWHGDDLISLGFAFSVANTNVVYLSDISRMKPETLDFIQKKLPPTDIFICDTLLNQGKHPVHFGLDQAMDLARKIGAKQTYLVGMNCDSFPGHDEMNARLAKEAGISIAFAHDGQVIALSSNDLRNQLR